MELTGLPPISSPMPWHAQEWIRLQRQLAIEQLPHALLLVGGQSTGKSQFALALARSLLCSRTEGSFNCGRCRACDLSASGSHGDFLWVQPMESSRVIKIDQIRDTVRFINKTAGFGLRKVIVLAPIESMNINASNALLKSLEEPSNNTYLLLVCNRLYSVPATIRSRCQILQFGMPPREACLDWLDITTGSREHSRHVLELAEGLPMLAQQLFLRDGGEEFEARRLELQALLRGDLTLTQPTALWNEVGIDFFLDQSALEIQRLLASLPLDQLSTNRGKSFFRILDDIAGLRSALGAGANPNKQLIMEALLSKLRKLLGSDSHGDNIDGQIDEIRI